MSTGSTTSRPVLAAIHQSNNFMLVFKVSVGPHHPQQDSVSSVSVSRNSGFQDEPLSLRATATSRLYHCGVDEQLIMERTGHRSLEGVRSYKRTSNTQRENLSSILNQEKPHNHSTTPHESSSCTQIATQKHKQLVNVIGPSLPSSVFHHCTVNFYMAPGSNSSSTSSTKRANKRAFIESDSESD